MRLTIRAPDLGYAPRFLDIFLACAESHFAGDSIPTPSGERETLGIKGVSVMSPEIERKFLVKGTAWRQGDGLELRQGYLNQDKARTVRVRIVGDRGYLTIKGETNGMSRAEFEYEIHSLMHSNF